MHQFGANYYGVNLVKMDVIGSSPAMQEVFAVIARLKKSEINALISGELGTGKEIIARKLHENSPRSQKPFIRFSVDGLTEDLIEPEIVRSLEIADGGTLFIDEISNMSMPIQTILFKVLSEKRFFKLDENQEVKVDVRLLASTAYSLEKRIQQQQFREDFYHRLNVVHIHVPPLRQRKEDIALLIKHFLETSANELNIEKKQLTAGAMELMLSYQWPGNVLELENMCRHLTLMQESTLLMKESLPQFLQSLSANEVQTNWLKALQADAQTRLNMGQADIYSGFIKKVEKELIQVALEYTKGHKQSAAKKLGLGRNTLTRKLKELGLK